MRTLGYASLVLAAACAKHPRSISNTGNDNSLPIRSPTSRVLPPLAGGTLIALKDDLSAVAADPDRDLLWVVGITGDHQVAHIALSPGDEPGRLVEDAAGRVHVVLRGAGAIADVDIAAGKVIARRSVCAEPRGIAFDAAKDALHVVCATGELVTFPAAGGAATRRVQLERDLRDVVVQGDRLLVSLFRAAQVLEIAPDGTVASRTSPAHFDDRGGGCGGCDVAAPPMASDGGAEDTGISSQSGRPFDPAVAWRMVANPAGGVALVHQRGFSGIVSVTTSGNMNDEGPSGAGAGTVDDGTPDSPQSNGGSNDVSKRGGGEQSGYGGGGFCGNGIVQSTVSLIRPGAQALAGSVINTVLPVDVAISADGKAVAVVGAGSGDVLVSSIDNTTISNCLLGERTNGGPVAVAFDGKGRLLIQLRSPAGLLIRDLQAEADRNSRNSESAGPPPSVISFGTWTTEIDDTGRSLFETATPLRIACASCHPEGREDGRTWTFDPMGKRRTQSLAGSLLSRAPFHWDGSEKELGGLLDDVLKNRMGGTPPSDRGAALGAWLDGLPTPAPAPSTNIAAVARGKDHFQGAGQCASCHAGDALTNNSVVDIGTGAAFKVPSLLGVAARAPFLHDGCAATLADRFGACGGDRHGVAAPDQIADLVAYLETL